MSYNGSGVFSITSSGQPVVATTLITAAAFNALTADLATGLSTAICRDGQSTITANIPMSGFKLTGLGEGQNATDAASLVVIQDGVGVYADTVGGTADAITLTMVPAITGYGAGQTFRFKASGANTGAVTVAINGLSAEPVTKNGATALVAGDIASGAIVQITHDGSRFILTATNSAILNSPTINSPVLSGSVTGTYTLAGTPTITAPTITVPSINTITLTGGQIAFPASQAASAGANTLDDYEEGTWTPAVGGSATYTEQAGTYTKIGRAVFISCRLIINAIGSGSAYLITGLPFQVNANAPGLGAVDWTSGAASPDTLFAYAVPGTTTVQLQGTTAPGTGTSPVTVMGNSTTIVFSLFYFV